MSEENKILSTREVMHESGYSRASLYRLMAAKQFPRQIKLGQGAQGKVGWWSDEIRKWQNSRRRVGTD